MMENAVQMQNYVQMLIGFTRSVPGTSVCRRNADLTLCLREVRKQAERLCRIGQVELSWDCQLREREVYAEPELLVRALLNLVDNAVEYTPRGGTVSFRAAEDGSSLIFTVSDTGPGFSGQALKRGRNSSIWRMRAARLQRRTTVWDCISSIPLCAGMTGSCFWKMTR